MWISAAGAKRKRETTVKSRSNLLETESQGSGGREKSDP
jgi:hypothetical protein